MHHVAVIGAGITGVTSAYALRKLGCEVTVIDRQRYCAMETSYANGGQLSASNAEVWNNTSTLIKGIRWMFRRDAPLLVNPSFSWHKYSWMAEFMRNVSNYRQNTVETTRLAIAARQHLYQMAEEADIDFDLEQRGILHLYYDRKSFEAGRRVNALLREGGLERHEVDPQEAQRLEPAVQRDCYGGFYTPSDATGDIHKFTCGLAQACERMGVQFRMDSEVTSITPQGRGHRVLLKQAGGTEQEQLSVDAVVICAGTASRRFGAMLGDRINIYPVKGYSITVNLDDERSAQAAPWISLLDEEAKIVTSRLGRNRFRVAGTAEFNGYNKDIRADRIQPLTDWVRRSFPNVDTSRVVPWTGLRPMMPDMMPRVRAGKRSGVFYNTGHGHLGWTLSAVTAQMLAGMVTTQRA
ncbi:D-amino acid dehydrogenase [Pollutimonas thiosulfatoxidans]|uniref:D-amino acid dehydrogenase n=1 Tax=Pollutimonas thiosulfatoxidans TaxID=2028345 RepID=A0A410GF26_9BURK|nr:D-amino acid dehydrogenase [Pollutimonas thiosulfatoxidans]QAA94888.1 D-amino acid dehydrogenase [Pollutimonas thiosulfatoxidans]